jgi:predicted anti-sigma-YlaC factor YlaD
VKVDLNCKEVSRLISQRHEGNLAGPDLARLRLHFVICRACRTVDEQMAFLRQAMRELGKDKPPKD